MRAGDLQPTSFSWTGFHPFNGGAPTPCRLRTENSLSVPQVFALLFLDFHIGANPAFGLEPLFKDLVTIDNSPLNMPRPTAISIPRVEI